MANKYYIKKHVIVTQVEDVVPGPDTIVEDLSQIIQSLIDNRFITGLNVVYENILTTTDTTVTAGYIGVTPTCVVTGSNEETVTITIPSGCTPVSFKVEGKPGNTDSSDRRTVVFTGAGVPGNTSIADIIIPGIIKSALTTSFGGPSASIPWSVDFGSPGDADIIGVGTTSSPSLSLRINNLNILTDRHLIQFIW